MSPGLLRRKELAIEIIEAEIRSAQYEVLLDASKLVLSPQEPVEVARHLRERAEQTIRPRYPPPVLTPAAPPTGMSSALS